jgi:peptidoglycan/LPS O-acetylase OafA/YrhL
VLTPCRLDSLCIGAWFAFSAQAKDALPVQRAMRWLAASAVIILALSILHVASTRFDTVMLPLRTSLLAVFFGLFIYVASRPASWPLVQATLRAPWLRGLGKYSYGLYVYHGLVAYAMHRFSPAPFLLHLVHVHFVASVLQVAFGVAVSLALAFVSYELFEARFLALKSRFEYGRTALPIRQKSEARTAPALS